MSDMDVRVALEAVAAAQHKIDEVKGRQTALSEENRDAYLDLEKARLDLIAATSRRFVAVEGRAAESTMNAERYEDLRRGIEALIGEIKAGSVGHQAIAERLRALLGESER